jgi:hypothetical protein
MRQDGDGCLQSDVASAFRDQKPKEHPKSGRTFLGCRPSGGSTGLQDKVPQARRIKSFWLLSEPSEQLANVGRVIVQGTFTAPALLEHPLAECTRTQCAAVVGHAGKPHLIASRRLGPQSRPMLGADRPSMQRPRPHTAPPTPTRARSPPMLLRSPKTRQRTTNTDEKGASKPQKPGQSNASHEGGWSCQMTLRVDPCELLDRLGSYKASSGATADVDPASTPKPLPLRPNQSSDHDCGHWHVVEKHAEAPEPPAAHVKFRLATAINPL